MWWERGVLRYVLHAVCVYVGGSCQAPALPQCSEGRGGGQQSRVRAHPMAGVLCALSLLPSLRVHCGGLMPWAAHSVE